MTREEMQQKATAQADDLRRRLDTAYGEWGDSYAKGREPVFAAAITHALAGFGCDVLVSTIPPGQDRIDAANAFMTTFATFVAANAEEPHSPQIVPLDLPGTGKPN